MSTAGIHPPRPAHWAHLGESTFVLGIWLLFWIHRLLGRWPFRLCLYPVVVFYWISNPQLRAASLQYLQRLQAATGALGRAPSRSDSLRHVALFGETMLDKLLAVSGRYQQAAVRLENSQHVKPGGVIVTAHMGCLELCRSMAEKYTIVGGNKVKLNILVHTRHAEQFNRVLKRLNPQNDFRLIEVSQISPATAILLAEKIAAGEYVVIAGDRIPVVAGRTVGVDFLGHAAQLPIGPYVLAALLKCPLYLLGCIHENSGYAIHFEVLADKVELPRRHRDQAIAAYAALYVTAITALLKRSPYDWFNFFPFWDQANATTK
ncbi:acyltransferase [Undibacterium sp. TJN25]|uniref:acyltransferase n=1 Tax=Undibacterium sp. TJN25 TaxID=3413056 RepID=UPI003BF15F68